MFLGVISSRQSKRDMMSVNQGIGTSGPEKEGKGKGAHDVFY